MLRKKPTRIVLVRLFLKFTIFCCVAYYVVKKKKQELEGGENAPEAGVPTIGVSIVCFKISCFILIH